MAVDFLTPKNAIIFRNRIEYIIMKLLLLSAATILLSLTAKAQYAMDPDYFQEVSLNIGVAPFTQPGIASYTGSKNVLPLVYTANYHYNFTENFQAGLELQLTKMKATGEQVHTGTTGTNLGAQTTTYLYADRIWSLAARANYVVPSYDEYHVNRSNFYIGLAAGAAFTVNDGAIVYGSTDNTTSEASKYVSEYRYRPGSGFVLGGQIGYTYYVGNQIGLNIEAAPRYTHIYSIDSRYAGKNDNFDFWSLPVTIGLRFRF